MKIPRQGCTAEFKELAITRVNDELTAGAGAKELGLVEHTVQNWVKADAADRRSGVGAKVVTPEQMELSRRCAENVRRKRENEILKNDGVLCKGHPVRYAWMEGQRTAYILDEMGGAGGECRIH
jgi:transposase